MWLSNIATRWLAQARCKHLHSDGMIAALFDPGTHCGHILVYSYLSLSGCFELSLLSTKPQHHVAESKRRNRKRNKDEGVGSRTTSPLPRVRSLYLCNTAPCTPMDALCASCVLCRAAWLHRCMRCVIVQSVCTSVCASVCTSVCASLCTRACVCAYAVSQAA